MSAEEFRKTWLKENPNIIHIPSEHELYLMETYYQNKVNAISDEEINKSMNEMFHAFKGILNESWAAKKSIRWYKEQLLKQ